MADPKVTARIAELRAPVIEEVRIGLADHLKELATLRDSASKAEQYASAVTAEVSRGKASGLYTDKLDVTITDALADRLQKARARGRS